MGVVYALYRITCHSSKAHPTTKLVAGAVTICEGLFAFFCWGSCVANYADRGYSGGLSACDFQGWYSGFYTFSQPLIIGLAGVVAFLGGRQGTLLRWRKTLSALALIFCFAAVMATLPFMGK